MLNKYNPQSIFWIMIFFILSYSTPSTVTAHNKVVVIPMSGDDLKPLKNLISVAKQNGDFNNPIAAVNSITNASVSNPYLVVIAPGIYDLGNATLTLKPYISIQGSGVDITTIRSAGTTAEHATVKVVAHSSISDSTILNNSTGSVHTIGVIAGGEDARLSSCKIIASNPSFQTTGFAMDAGNNQSIALERIEINVPSGNNFGVSSLATSFVQDSSLRINNSEIVVEGAGTGIGRIGIVAQDLEFSVTNTTIEMLAGGVAVANSDGETQLYKNLIIVGYSINTLGFDGRGSGFRPILEDSHIELRGAGSVAIRTNNGRPIVNNSYIFASTTFQKASTTFFTPTFKVNNSIIEARDAVLQDGGGNMVVRFSASKLDVINNINIVDGTVDAICVHSHDKNYNEIASNCI